MRTPLFPTIFALLTLIVFIAAQTVNLLPSNLPACAQQCTILTQAQGSCTPPLAPVTTDTIYESCFCQSALLTSLYSNTNAQLCTSCSSTDMATIQQWYQGVCPDNGRGAPNFGTLATGPTTTSVATGPTTTSSVTTANSGTSNQQDPTTSTNPAPEGSWYITLPPPTTSVLYMLIVLIGYQPIGAGSSCSSSSFSVSPRSQSEAGSSIAVTTGAAKPNGQTRWERQTSQHGAPARVCTISATTDPVLGLRPGHMERKRKQRNRHGGSMNRRRRG